MISKLKLTTIILIIIGFTLPKEVKFGLGCLCVLFNYQSNKSFINISNKVLLPIFLTFLIGLIMGLSAMENNKITDILRDSFLILKIPVYFWVGIIISRKVETLNDFFGFFKLIAISSAILHILTFLLNYHSGLSLDDLRKDTGLGSLVQAIFLSMLISQHFNKKFNTLFSKNAKLPLYQIGLVVLSFILYFSRSMIVTTFVISIFLVDIINIRNFSFEKNKRIIILILFFCVGIIALISFAPKNESGLFGELYNKFANIPNEVLWDASRNTNASSADITHNWRGYESYQGLLKFYEGTDLQKVFGYGLGALVDLNLEMVLGGTAFTEIPVLHNGYVEVLVKEGIAGVILYLLFLHMIGFSKVKFTSKTTESYFIYQFLSAIAAATLLNTFTVSGLLNKSEAITPILLGFFWCMAEREKIKFFHAKKGRAKVNNELDYIIQ